MREGWCEIKLAQCVNNITKFYEIKTTMLQLYYKTNSPIAFRFSIC